jgi:phage-related protein
MAAGTPRDVTWIASSLADLRDFPDAVKQTMGVALFQAQLGGKHIQAKPLKGFKGGGVLEVVEDFDGKTYRTMYTVRYADAVYVLHAFQKKSKKGIATPKHEMELVKARLLMAEELHQAKNSQKKGK